jgi:hypothetical protein
VDGNRSEPISSDTRLTYYTARHPRSPRVAGRSLRCSFRGMADVILGHSELRFQKILQTVEQKLVLSLAEARDTTSHSGDKGANVEAETRAVLQQYLPNTFGISHGKVYDEYGDESAQADVVVTNADHPFSYPQDKAGAFIIEGVAAVGEVKSVLTTDELERCINAGAQFKRLRQTFQNGDNVRSPLTHALLKETAGTPPFFVIAFENKIADDTLLERLRDAALVEVPAGKEANGSVSLHPIDCVCLLGQGFL